jgi:hypothetical protein
MQTHAQLSVCEDSSHCMQIHPQPLILADTGRYMTWPALCMLVCANSSADAYTCRHTQKALNTWKHMMIPTLLNKWKHMTVPTLLWMHANQFRYMLSSWYAQNFAAACPALEMRKWKHMTVLTLLWMHANQFRYMLSSWYAQNFAAACPALETRKYTEYTLSSWYGPTHA